jgi:hypothetical protein
MRSIFESPEAKAFRLCHDGAPEAPARSSTVIRAPCPIEPASFFVPVTLSPPTPSAHRGGTRVEASMSSSTLLGRLKSTVTPFARRRSSQFVRDEPDSRVILG